MFSFARFAALVAAILLSTLATPPIPATAATFDPGSMVFPLRGDDYRLTDNFGACRDGCDRHHEGEDIMAPKMTEVVAVADGRIAWVNVNHKNCGICVNIEHADGWSTSYVHLNNDTPGTDDGQAVGLAPGIQPGVFVSKGQLIGWVGDSGNAENVGSHLHFELRNDGEPVDPHPYLLIAAESWNGTFRDDDSSVHEADIEWIAEEGITRGCNPPTNDRFCPTSPITRGEMAAFLVRALDLTEDPDHDLFVDDDGHLFEAEIERLAVAGITMGCNPPDNDRFCPDDHITRGQMAALLSRALNLPPASGDSFVDDDGHLFEAEIEQIKAAGITKGCNPPANDQFCPDSSLTRAEMATFLVRALTLLEN